MYIFLALLIQYIIDISILTTPNAYLTDIYSQHTYISFDVHIIIISA